MKKRGSGKRVAGRAGARRTVAKTMASRPAVKKAAAKKATAKKTLVYRKVAASETATATKVAAKKPAVKWGYRSARPGPAETARRQQTRAPGRALADGLTIVVRRTARRPASTPVQRVTAPELTAGTYLVRPAGASVAQALGHERVELNATSREAYLNRLREFRNDTRGQVRDLTSWAGEHGRKVSMAQGLIASGAVMKLSAKEAKQLRQDLPGVQLIQNRPLPLIAPTASRSTRLPPQAAAWHLEAIGQRTARADGRAFSGKNVSVAVLDTGVERRHPELHGRVKEAWRIRVKPRHNDSRDLVRDAAHRDTDGHGTHVAGLICGTHVGVAPDAALASLLLMPGGMATVFDFISCLDWVVDRPDIGLVNVSAGVLDFNDDMMSVVEEVMFAGKLPFFAVGNGGENLTRSPGNYPIGVSVGATNAPDGRTVASFSGSGRYRYHGPNYRLGLNYSVPNLVAPGQAIHSSHLGDGYLSLDGTSMATPIACGVAACFIEANGGLLTALELFDLLKKSCTKLKLQPKWRQGYGLVQVPLLSY